MMDAAEIREALEWFAATKTEHRSDDHPVAVLAEAARAHAEWLEQGQTVEPHIAPGDGPYTANLHLEPGRYFVVPLGEEIPR